MDGISLVYPIVISIADVVEKDMEELTKNIDILLGVARDSLIDEIEQYKKRK